MKEEISSKIVDHHKYLVLNQIYIFLPTFFIVFLIKPPTHWFSESYSQRGLMVKVTDTGQLVQGQGHTDRGH